MKQRQRLAPLPFDAAQRRAMRPLKKTYRAILYLRKLGSTVYAAGKWHKLDGRMVTAEQLVAIARSRGME